MMGGVDKVKIKDGGRANCSVYLGESGSQLAESWRMRKSLGYTPSAEWPWQGKCSLSKDVGTRHVWRITRSTKGTWEEMIDEWRAPNRWPLRVPKTPKGWSPQWDPIGPIPSGELGSSLTSVKPWWAPWKGQTVHFGHTKLFQENALSSSEGC